MPEDVGEAEEEKLRLGRYSLQILAQEDTLKALQQKDFANQETLALILLQLDITLSALRDALMGAGDRDFTTLETDTEAILARLQGDTGAHATVSVGTSATSILAANASRKEWLIYNNGAAILYLGSSSGVTTANGIPIVPQRAASGRIYKGAFWGIVSAGSIDVRRWEVT